MYNSDFFSGAFKCWLLIVFVNIKDYVDIFLALRVDYLATCLI